MTHAASQLTPDNLAEGAAAYLDSADPHEVARALIRQAEDIARSLRYITKGALSLAVVDNHGVTLREREGLGWHDAHEAAQRAVGDPAEPDQGGLPEAGAAAVAVRHSRRRAAGA